MRGMAKIYKGDGHSVGVESDCFLEHYNGFLIPACNEQGAGICCICAGIEGYSPFPPAIALSYSLLKT